MSTTPKPILIEGYDVQATGFLRTQKVSEVGLNFSTLPTSETTRFFQSNNTQISVGELLYNGTGYYIEDETETGLNDLQTVFLACFATLISLVVTLLTAFGIRILWQKYKTRRTTSKYDGILRSEGTSESISRPLHSHLLSDQDCDKVHVAINTEEVTCGQYGTTEISNSQVRTNNHSNTNGSIITMTLKNNHLIVETEERNDIEEDSRETKLKYCPAARDGVFVVEVQQGVRRSPGSGGPQSEISLSVSDQCALVHNPPDRYSDEETLEECDDSEYYIETVSPNRDTPDSLRSQIRTGLTQSDTSLTHLSYCYTNQQGYDSGHYGYPIYTGYNDEVVHKECEPSRKPKITAAVYKSGLKRSPSSENLHLVTVAIGSDEERGSDEEDVSRKEMLNGISNFVGITTKFEKLQNDQESPFGKRKSQSKPVNYENKGFESSEAIKS